jgi:WD40 repeat protein
MVQPEVAQLQVYQGHRDCIYALCGDGGGKQLFTGGADGFIASWYPQQSSDGDLFARTDSPIFSLHISDDAQTLYAGTGNGELYIFNITDKKLVARLKLHEKGIFIIHTSGAHIITGGGDGLLRVSALNQPAEGIYHRLSEQSLRSICIVSEDIYIGCSDHHIYKLNSDFKIIQTLKGHTGSVFALCSIPGELLLSGGRDAKIHLHKQSGEQEILFIPGHILHVKDLVYAADLNIYISSSMDKSIKLWDANTHALLKVIDKPKFFAHGSSVNRLLYISGGLLFSVSDDKTMMSWRISR